ncbi:hypothetical protein [Jiulongibacter sp. NS-SX5]|uniref:hypothetical protein n=1 Tax=Jiulongibacter sp. NS-SX5 TaxID=3463854 RepID=UPI00405946BC
MKANIPVLLLFLFTGSLFAQSTTITPGTVLPQLTTAQRTTLANPVNGMMVYDTGTNSYWFYQQTVWTELPKGGSTANYWQLDGLDGNEIKNTNSGGFWSGGPSVSYASNPPAAPIEGDGTRLMWIHSRSAFRAGTVAFSSKSWNADSIGYSSFAVGLNSKAIGAMSISMGRDTKASGELSFAVGYNVSALGSNSVAMGYGSSAEGFISTALGSGKAKGDYSTAMGSFSTASGNTSTAFGSNTMALGGRATAFGSNTTAQGDLSTAMGSYTRAVGDISTTFGNGSYASGDNSTAFGYYTTAKAADATAIGRYNDVSDNPDPSIRSLTDRLFQIGNGSYNIFTGANYNNAMTVLRNGNTGINTTDPTSALDVHGFSQLGESSPKIKLKKLTGTTSSVQFGLAILSHGLDATKILSIDVIIETSTTRYINESYATTRSGYAFDYYFNDSSVIVTNLSSSSSILSKPIKVLITYEE